MYQLLLNRRCPISHPVAIRCASAYVILLRNQPTMCVLVQSKDQGSVYTDPSGDYLINPRCDHACCCVWTELRVRV